MVPTKSTLVFLCTYQGIAFLDAQIRSILAQSVPIDLWVSDDGSTDGTRELVERYVTTDPRVRLLDGPSHGFVANFLSVFENPGVFDYSFLAFADQDDIWDTELNDWDVKLMALHNLYELCQHRVSLSPIGP